MELKNLKLEILEQDLRKTIEEWKEAYDKKDFVIPENEIQLSLLIFKKVVEDCGLKNLETRFAKIIITEEGRIVSRFKIGKVEFSAQLNSHKDAIDVSNSLEGQFEVEHFSVINEIFFDNLINYTSSLRREYLTSLDYVPGTEAFKAMEEALLEK